jgi:hypothetical protein
MADEVAGAGSGVPTGPYEVTECLHLGLGKDAGRRLDADAFHQSSTSYSQHQCNFHQAE